MIEYRSFRIEAREQGSRTVSGYGSVFNSQSEDLGFIETIDPNAITEETIKRSDVFATLNHDMDKILARCKYGSGSLELKCDDKGLYYRFDAPNTDLGDELLEYLNRGEIDSSSFAFTVKRDEWKNGDDGKPYRRILEIDQIFDISPVFCPAYPEAICQKRNKPSDYADKINTLEKRDMDNKEKLIQLEEEIKKLKAEMEAEEKPAEDPVEEPMEGKEAPGDYKKPDEEKIEEKEAPGECKKPDEEKIEEKESPVGCGKPDDPIKDEEDPEERNNLNKNKNTSIRKMEKKFSLVKELRNAMETGKSVNLNEIAKRAYTVTDEGVDVVETDIYDILEPLRAKNVLVAAGAKFITNLQGNVQVPVMSATQVGWKGETAAADDGSGAFTSVTLSPKRLTGKFPVSLELLAQDTLGVENMIRQDIVNAINEKLEATILGAGAGDLNTPAGLFHGYADTNVIADFGDIADLEAKVEEKNVYGNCKYIVSPKAKAKLRSTIKGTAGVGMILENGAIDGTEALATSNVPAGKMLYGDFSNLVIGQWDSVILDVVRDTESLANGCVTIVCNAYFDAKVAREGAIVAANVQ